MGTSGRAFQVPYARVSFQVIAARAYNYHPTLCCRLTDVTNIPAEVPPVVSEPLAVYMSSAVDLLASMRDENESRSVQHQWGNGSACRLLGVSSLADAAPGTAAAVLPPTPAVEWMLLQSPLLRDHVI